MVEGAGRRRPGHRTGLSGRGARGIYLFTYDGLFSPELEPGRRKFLIDGIRELMGADER